MTSSNRPKAEDNMFKGIGNFIHRTPWWALAAGGLVVLLGLVMFAVPIQVIRLHDRGATPQERRAIDREINLAFGDTALNFAEDLVRAMRDRAGDTDRQRELDHALAEIARAKKDLSVAQSDASRAARDTARASADSAVEAAMNAAETALDTAVEARQAMEQARNDAVELLRDRGLDASATAASFEGMLKNAVEHEKAAREALQAMRSLHRDQPSATAAVPANPLPYDLRGEIRKKVDGDVWRVGVGSALILGFIPLFVILLISKYFLGRSRRALAVAEEKTQEAQVSHISRQITEARLQALQAQVEPHFLYNTLANVQALTEVDAKAANKMVGHLIAYLRASLPKMRESTSTVGQELELVRAYLNILQMRMGDRLHFSISAPPDLLAKSFPPMMLPSLVENAIKHGLEPLRDGGRIDVVVQQSSGVTGDCISVQVRDTGKGLSEGPLQTGSGIGLSNVRERLSAIYGAAARFGIEANSPQGVVASIDIPTQVPPLQGERASLSASESAIDAPLLQSGWRRAKSVTSKSHSVWVRVVTRTLLVLMVALCIAFLVALLGLYTGWMPVQIGDLKLDGIEGLAVGSVGLLVAFGAVALAILLVVAVLYGLGFFLAALLLFIPLVVLVSLFPVVFPFVLAGLIIYWLIKRDRQREI
jgi:hypothetical protein